MCLPVSQSMAASKTYKKRAWTFFAPSSTLVITQDKHADSYTLEEQASEKHGVRVFMLAHKNRTEVYEVTIGQGMPRCSGTYCGKKATCMHRDAVLGLIASGELDVQPADENADQGHDLDAYIQEMEAYHEGREDIKAMIVREDRLPCSADLNDIF
jgi:hypothetical protein